MPVDNSEAAGAAQRTGFVKRYNYVGTGEGTTFRITEWAPGDVVVQRGTTHTWVNRGSVPAVTAFILIDAKPAEVNGELLRTLFPM
ncbi:MAG: hypothetical protein ACRET7_13905 [Burkholderiales bacterium]